MLRSSQILQLTVVALLAIGVVMVHSASMTVGGPGTPGAAVAPGLLGPLGTPAVPGAITARGISHTDPMSVLLSKNAFYAGLAILAMVLASRINVRQLFRVRGWANPLLWIVTLSLVLVGLTYVPGLGKRTNGASRWLYLGPRSLGLSFQPSELVKWVMVVAIAWWCSRRRGVIHKFLIGLLPALLLIGVACGLIVIEDLGTAALVGLVAGCILIAGGARLWQLGLVIPPAAAAVVAAIAHSPYRRDRLLGFLDPWKDPRGIGYHPIQSMLTIAQGGLFGRGLGNGIQKFGYLPEDTTDFIFAVICEELGLIGAITVVCLYLVLLWVGLGIIRDCKDTFGRLLGLGVLLTIGIQALINIAVVTVVVPSKGIALPLISGGGTGWVLTAFALGLVAALDEANYLGETLDEPVPLARQTAATSSTQAPAPLPPRTPSQPLAA